MKIRTLIVLFCLTLAGGSACSREPATSGLAPPTTIPATAPAVNLTRVQSSPGAKVFIAEPAEGAMVSNPVTVKFGVEGIELAPAGEVRASSGHHHLLIDVETLPPLDHPLPFSDSVFHFGQAQTEASVNLVPGPHTLQLIFAAGNHIPHDPPVMSEKISIIVK